MTSALVARRRLLAVAAVLVLLSEVFAFCRIGTGVHAVLLGYVQKGDGFFSACLLAGAVIYATSKPAHDRAFLGAGVVGELLQAVLRGHDDYLHNAGAMFGVVALVLSGWEALERGATKRSSSSPKWRCSRSCSSPRSCRSI